MAKGKKGIREEPRETPIYLRPGNIALVVFLIVKAVNRLRAAPPPPPNTKDCPLCLTAIPLGAKRCPACCADLA